MLDCKPQHIFDRHHVGERTSEHNAREPGSKQQRLSIMCYDLLGFNDPDKVRDWIVRARQIAGTQAHANAILQARQLGAHALSRLPLVPFLERFPEIAKIGTEVKPGEIKGQTIITALDFKALAEMVDVLVAERNAKL